MGKETWPDKKDFRDKTIAKMIMEQYKPGNRKEAQRAIKDIFGTMFEAILQGEMEEHLGYANNGHNSKETDNHRNEYIDKYVRTTYEEIPILVSRDQDSSFEPQIIPKCSRDVSGIEDKVMAMYAKGWVREILQRQ